MGKLVVLYRMGDTFLFTSESVNEGHPDKLADQVGFLSLLSCKTFHLAELYTAAGHVLYLRWLRVIGPTEGPADAYIWLRLYLQVSDAVLDACLAQDPYAKVRASSMSSDIVFGTPVPFCVRLKSCIFEGIKQNCVIARKSCIGTSHLFGTFCPTGHAVENRSGPLRNNRPLSPSLIRMFLCYPLVNQRLD